MTRPHPVQWWHAHRRFADWLLALAVFLLGLAAHFGERSADLRAGDVLGAVLVALATLPLVARRRSPFGSLMVMAAAQLALETRQQAGPAWLGVLVGSYSLGTAHAGRRLWWMAGAFVTSVLAYTAVGVAVGKAPWGALVSTALIFPAAVVFGDSMRRRRERAEHLVERAERAERERELLAARQVQHERSRIARELHDVVAHSVSAMVLQAGAARRQLHSNPAVADAALSNVEEMGRRAMAEMRQILGVLREAGEAASTAPQPSLHAVGQLVSSSPDLPVALSHEGDLSGVPSGIELSAYRIIQEALTNVRRHAGPVGAVQVNLRRAPTELVVEVVDDGRGASAAGGQGFGLAGMAERVAAFGGALVAGPRLGGGWQVRASFPLAVG